MGREAKKNDNRKTYTANTLLSEMLIGTEKQRKSYHKIAGQQTIGPIDHINYSQLTIHQIFTSHEQGA